MLTVKSFAGFKETHQEGSRPRRASYVIAVCDCGKDTLVNVYHVKNGNVGSCGCSRSKFLIQAKTKHGHAPFNRKQSKVYTIWKGMKRRCSNPNDSHFKHYGGRGITVCERWCGEDGFLNFLIDMGEPAPGMSIERKDNDKDYDPDNCVWIPLPEQAKNRNYNWRVRLNGELMTARELSRRLGCGPSTIDTQLRNGGFRKDRCVPFITLGL